MHQKLATEEVTTSKLSDSIPLLHPSTVKHLIPSTPINVNEFQSMLALHPNQALVQEVCQSFRTGVDIGFKGTRSRLYTPNMKSALDNPAVIHATIRKEVESGWSSGPFSTSPFQNFVVNSIGVVPKKSGGLRMIADLSRSEEGVNHGIEKDQFSLEYSSIDDAIGILKNVGPEAHMCKLDIKDAFRLILVRQEDWPLLGYEWDGEYFFHTRLPFGLRSSPFHFSKFSLLLAWIVGSHCNPSSVLCYLDDFWYADFGERCL